MYCFANRKHSLVHCFIDIMICQKLLILDLRAYTSAHLANVETRTRSQL